jgi:hypothetical protein
MTEEFLYQILNLITFICHSIGSIFSKRSLFVTGSWYLRMVSLSSHIPRVENFYGVVTDIPGVVI